MDIGGALALLESGLSIIVEDSNTSSSTVVLPRVPGDTNRVCWMHWRVRAATMPKRIEKRVAYDTKQRPDELLRSMSCTGRMNSPQVSHQDRFCGGCGRSPGRNSERAFEDETRRNRHGGKPGSDEGQSANDDRISYSES